MLLAPGTTYWEKGLIMQAKKESQIFSARSWPVGYSTPYYRTSDEVLILKMGAAFCGFLSRVHVQF